MHIDRKRLLKIAGESLRKMSSHRVGLTDEVPIPSGVILTEKTTWAEIRDFDFLLWLTEQIVMLDPMENCIIVGEPSDWDGLDPAKCMRFVEKGLALPIGNLTSQLFSNVYLNIFDQYVKRVLLCSHYGRYVDDSVMIDPDREWLLAQVPKVREFLWDELGLELHRGKVHVQEVHRGVEFLGVFVKPYREYISNRTLERVQKKLGEVDLRNRDAALRTVNSYLGIMSHTASYNLRRSMFGEGEFAEIIEYDADMRKGWLVA